MRKTRGVRFFPFLSIFLLFFLLLFFLFVNRRDQKKKQTIKRPIALIAHRGSRGSRVENSLEAFAYAMTLGVTSIETDVQLTADGVPVLSHSRILPWWTTKNAWGKFLVSDEQPNVLFSTLAELREYDLSEMSSYAPYGEWDLVGKTQRVGNGTRIATLEELFQLVHAWGNDQIELCIEAKSTPYPHTPNPSPTEWVNAIYTLACKYGMVHRIYLLSFDWRVLREAKRIDPNLRTGALTANQPEWNQQIGDEGDYENERWMGESGDPIEIAARLGADVLSVYEKTVTEDMIHRVHSLGMHLVPYTVNDPGRMKELIEMGVDGIVTDRVKVARNVMSELGVPLPPADPDAFLKPYYTGTEDKEHSPRR